jgi:hypothetical protein
MQTIILEEFGIPEERLFLDFYMPHHSLAFEYQGPQHSEFNSFFHGDKKGFENSKARDKRKLDWCILNGISLVEVNGNVTAEDLKEFIQKVKNNNE